MRTIHIYNSRNYSILLNQSVHADTGTSTTVEIILYYSTGYLSDIPIKSTTVEIILYYSTFGTALVCALSTTVEIILYYSTSKEDMHSM